MAARAGSSPGRAGSPGASVGQSGERRRRRVRCRAGRHRSHDCEGRGRLEHPVRLDVGLERALELVPVEHKRDALSARPPEELLELFRLPVDLQRPRFRVAVPTGHLEHELRLSVIPQHVFDLRTRDSGRYRTSVLAERRGVDQSRTIANCLHTPPSQGPRDAYCAT